MHYKINWALRRVWTKTGSSFLEASTTRHIPEAIKDLNVDFALQERKWKGRHEEQDMQDSHPVQPTLFEPCSYQLGSC